jgi:hypothetical protein
MVRGGPLASWRLGGPLVSAALLVSGCLQLATGADGGAGTASGSSSSSDAGAAGAAAAGGGKGATSGTDCTTDPASQITLCEQIANCPGVVVDPGAFPGCGFRLYAGSLYDLECGCGDSLCPLGVPTSCADAQRLLDQEQSSVLVCQQVGEGTCLPLATDAGAATSPCDRECESQCAGDPTCIQMCGC